MYTLGITLAKQQTKTTNETGHSDPFSYETPAKNSNKMALFSINIWKLCSMHSRVAIQHLAIFSLNASDFVIILRVQAENR